MASDKEPFPLLNTSLDPFAMDEDSAPRRRRKSSGLGGEIRAGDTGAPAFASSRASLNAGDSFGHQVSFPSFLASFTWVAIPIPVHLLRPMRHTLPPTLSHGAS